MRGGHPGQLFFNLDPDRHGVNRDRLSRETRDEQLSSVLFLDHHPEGIGNLESPFVIDFRGIIAPQDGV